MNRIGRLNRCFKLQILFIIPIACLLSCDQQEKDKISTLHDTLEQAFDSENAYNIVEYLSDRWRLRGGGNRGFDESIDHVFELLKESGFEKIGSLKILEGPLTLQPLAWQPLDASLELISPESKLLHTYADTPTMIGKYSGSTPEAGITGELVDVGDGIEAADYSGKSIAGKIVLARGAAEKVISEAIASRGALGVISDRLSNGDYYDRFPGMVLYETMPFGEPGKMKNRKEWLLKISPATGRYLRELLQKGEARLRVKVQTEFFESTQRTLIAEIPGESVPEERVVLVSHIDNNKPGANNNASGVGAHAELARAMANLISDGRLLKPGRTITFLFGAEREGTRQWLDAIGENASKIIAMLNADMTGEKTALTGGTYRLEKSPEPTMYLQRPAKYTQPEDRHSGWGFRPLEIDPFPGHFLNALVWDIVQYHAAKVDWPVVQHPFEGGSDHDVSLPRKIPTTLSWHWVDDFISTNLDTPDKVSRQEMLNVALVHGIAALRMATAEESDALAVLDLQEKRALERLQLETETTQQVLADFDSNAYPVDEKIDTREKLVERELELFKRWVQWHDEALASVEYLPVKGATELLQERVRVARETVALLWESYVQEIMGGNE